MRITPINNTNFQGGNVKLRSLNPLDLRTYEALKKIAEARYIDISIAPHTRSKHFLQEAVYMVTASKTLPKKAGETFNMSKCGDASSYAVFDKNACLEEVSVKIYNAAINAIENLEKKFSSKIRN